MPQGDHYQCCHADAGEKDQLASLKEVLLEKLEEIQKGITSNEKVCVCVCVCACVCVCVHVCVCVCDLASGCFAMLKMLFGGFNGLVG